MFMIKRGLIFIDSSNSLYILIYSNVKEKEKVINFGPKRIIDLHLLWLSDVNIFATEIHTVRVYTCQQKIEECNANYTSNDKY